MLVRNFMFLKSGKHVLGSNILKVTFMTKTLFDYQGTKHCLVIEMYS